MDLYANLEVLNNEQTQPVIQKDIGARERILKLQDAMAAITDGDGLDDFPLNHYFAPGMYAREMFLPADHTIIGKIHKHAHLNIIAYGRVKVATEEGVVEMTGPCTFTSPAGVKRAVSVIEDTLWTTIHLTESTDLEQIEDQVIAKSFDEFDLFIENQSKEQKLIGDGS